MGLLSVPHLIVIFIVALVVFGPEKLPELARTLGKGLAEFRRATGDLRSTFEDHLRELERETETHRQQTSQASNPPEGTMSASSPSSTASAAPGDAVRNDTEKPVDGDSNPA